jgi:hypothetical protein
MKEMLSHASPPSLKIAQDRILRKRMMGAKGKNTVAGRGRPPERMHVGHPLHMDINISS